MSLSRLRKYSRGSCSASAVAAEIGKRFKSLSKGRGPRCLRRCRHRGKASSGRAKPACCKISTGGGIHHAGKIGELTGSHLPSGVLDLADGQRSHFSPLSVQQGDIGSVTAQDQLGIGEWL